MPVPSTPCPECGAPVFAGGPIGGLCPECLLAAGKAGDELETLPLIPSSGDEEPTLAAEPRLSQESVPETIGPYRLLGLLGEGGMGRVYAAEQTHPIQRAVALKILKPGMDSREILTRFEAERQALAVMNHPWIARVCEAGATPEGRPYFVMERVDGIPITDYCDRHELSIPQRLELFVKVCEAVKHAHQKGIIHRDLKPSNILVECQDGIASPKVIDFGLAKAVDRELSVRSMATQWGDLMGTPQYMSPEQALGNVDEIDTRSDVYSLGVILYELLAGEPPVSREEIRKAGILGVARLLEEREVERPSSRVKTNRNEATTVAAKRGIDPGGLDRRLRGELDWVALKCLEKEKGRRYESVSALAGDIERHLNDGVVSARPPSVSYRFRKVVKRNRTAVAAGFAVLLAIFAGSGVAVWQAIEAKTAQKGTAEALDRERVANHATELALDREREANRKTGLALKREQEANREAVESLSRETAANERLQARLFDLVALDRLSHSIVHDDPDRFVARHSDQAVHLRSGIRCALFPGPETLVLSMGSELRLLDLRKPGEEKRFQLREPVTALFPGGSDDHFLAVTSGIGQWRKIKIYRVSLSEGGTIESIFDCTAIKGLAAPDAFALGEKPGVILMAVGYSGSGHLGFESEMPGNPEQPLNDSVLEDSKSTAVFRFDIASRRITLEGTAENFPKGEWSEIRSEVSRKFPSFTWENRAVDGENFRAIQEQAPAGWKSDLMPLAVWGEELAVLAPVQETPRGPLDEGFQLADLRLYDAQSATLTGLPPLGASRDALDLSDRMIDQPVCDLRSLEHLTPEAWAKLGPDHQVFMAEPILVGKITLKRTALGDIHSGGDRKEFFFDLFVRMMTEVPFLRTFDEGDELASERGPGETWHVGLDGDVIFFIGRFRSFEGVHVYDGHSGKLLHRVDEKALNLSGTGAIGTSFMETDDCLLVAVPSGLLRVRRNDHGAWGHSIEPR